MLIDYNSMPRKSLFFTSSVLLGFLKNHNDIDSAIDEGTKFGIDPTRILLSIDWLFLIGIIKFIDFQTGKVTLCD